MKTKLFLVVAISALLVSCSNDDNDVINDGRVIFTSGVNATQTRVNGGVGNQWQIGDPIGIFMVEHGETTVAEGADNIKYTAVTNGRSSGFNPATETQRIYYPVNEPAKVDFIAYHPHAASVADYQYKIDLSDQSSQTGIDLMLAQKATNAGAGYDKTNTSAVNLTFNHQLVKVVMNVVAGEGVGSLDNLTVNFTNMNSTADFDLLGEDGITAEGPEGTKVNIAAVRTSDPTAASPTFEAILLPVASLANNHIVEFAVDGNTYKWAINDTNNSPNVTSLESAKIYDFTITLTKTKVLVSGKITPWESVGPVTGTAH